MHSCNGYCQLIDLLLLLLTTWYVSSTWWVCYHLDNKSQYRWHNNKQVLLKQSWSSTSKIGTWPQLVFSFFFFFFFFFFWCVSFIFDFIGVWCDSHFNVKSQDSIMSSKKVTVCLNIGCAMTFPYRMAKLCHSRKGFNGTPPEQMIVKVDKHWECKLCRTHIKHQNNIIRYKKVCVIQIKLVKYHECIHCKKVFQHLSKLNLLMYIHLC